MIKFGNPMKFICIREEDALDRFKRRFKDEHWFIWRNKKIIIRIKKIIRWINEKNRRRKLYTIVIIEN